MIYLDEEYKVFKETIREVEPRFDIKKADKQILDSIFAWVWKYDKLNILEWDYNKGLFFYGSLGRGKSMTLFALREYLRKVRSKHPTYHAADYRLGTYWLSASQLANKYAYDGQYGIDEYFEHGCCLFIDELGREPNPASNYGTKMNVLQFLLQMRYDNRKNCVTHVTTNLRLEDIATNYGGYVADRCLEMFNFALFTGESFR